MCKHTFRFFLLHFLVFWKAFCIDLECKVISCFSTGKNADSKDRVFPDKDLYYVMQGLKMPIIGKNTFEAYELPFSIDNIIEVDNITLAKLPHDEHIFIGDKYRFSTLAKMIRMCEADKIRREQGKRIESYVNIITHPLATTSLFASNVLDQFDKYVEISTNINETQIFLDYSWCDRLWFNIFKW